MSDPYIESPYDPQVPCYTEGTPGLEAVLMEAMRTVSVELRVGMPGRITQVRGDQQVDVQPLLRPRYKNKQSGEDLPVVQGVPVLMPMGSAYGVYLPLTAGDTGWLMFCDRSLATFLASDGSSTVDPAESRAHSLNDAVFIPGCPATAKQTTNGSRNLVYSCGNAILTLSPSGTFSLKSTATNNELVSLITQLAGAAATLANVLKTAAVTTPSGPGTFDPATVALITTYANQLSMLQNSLSTLQG